MANAGLSDIASLLSRQLGDAIEHIRQAMVGLQFCQVSVILQDGVVVQDERARLVTRKGGEIVSDADLNL